MSGDHKMDSHNHKPMFGQTGGQHPLAALVDHRETYGPHVIERFVRSISGISSVVDIGAGPGRDLEIVKRIHSNAKTIAIEGGRRYANDLQGKVDQVIVLNVEREPLPFSNESIDLILANQVLEHTKEIFWIFHEVSRSLRIGGHFLFGVPNVASFHNRLLLLFGVQPTQHKLCSAHVRPFSKNDTRKFVDACFPGGYSLSAFGGAQFYPFPPRLARLLANVFPTAAFSIFFLFRKERQYRDEFALYPVRALLETNFWTGNVVSESQYSE
jgi:SAM-dependent methyltransferase